MAGIVVCEKKVIATIAGKVIPCVKSTVAGFLTARYEGWSRVAGFIDCTKTTASAIAAIVIPCVESTVAGFIKTSKTTAHAVAGIVVGDKTSSHSVAGIVHVQPLPWETTMESN